MKTVKILSVFILSFVLFSCEKDELDIENPDVRLFVEQLKNGTYNQFERNGNGEKVGAEMPAFTLKHVSQLIDYAADTSFIPDLSCVPINPISSRLMWPINRPGKVFLGEYLLWCAQYAIDGHFPSLDPFLVNTNEEKTGKGITAKEVLLVRDYYENWWNLYNENVLEAPYPLGGTPYIWF